MNVCGSFFFAWFDEGSEKPGDSMDNEKKNESAAGREERISNSELKLPNLAHLHAMRSSYNLFHVPGSDSTRGTLLVANRGEIAIRIIRAAQDLELKTISIYSHEDRLRYAVLCCAAWHLCWRLMGI